MDKSRFPDRWDEASSGEQDEHFDPGKLDTDERDGDAGKVGSEEGLDGGQEFDPGVLDIGDDEDHADLFAETLEPAFLRSHSYSEPYQEDPALTGIGLQQDTQTYEYWPASPPDVDKACDAADGTADRELEHKEHCMRWSSFQPWRCLLRSIGLNPSENTGAGDSETADERLALKLWLYWASFGRMHLFAKHKWAFPRRPGELRHELCTPPLQCGRHVPYRMPPACVRFGRNGELREYLEGRLLETLPIDPFSNTQAQHGLARRAQKVQTRTARLFKCMLQLAKPLQPDPSIHFEILPAGDDGSGAGQPKAARNAKGRRKNVYVMTIGNQTQIVSNYTYRNRTRRRFGDWRLVLKAAKHVVPAQVFHIIQERCHAIFNTAPVFRA